MEQIISPTNSTAIQRSRYSGKITILGSDPSRRQEVFSFPPNKSRIVLGLTWRPVCCISKLVSTGVKSPRLKVDTCPCLASKLRMSVARFLPPQFALIARTGKNFIFLHGTINSDGGTNNSSGNNHKARIVRKH